MKPLVLALICSLTLNFTLINRIFRLTDDRLPQNYKTLKEQRRENLEAKRKKELLAIISDYQKKSQEEAKQSLLDALSFLRKQTPDKEPKDISSCFGYYSYMYELTLALRELSLKNYVNACDELEKAVLFYPVFQPHILSAIILLLERFWEGNEDVF